MAFTLPKLDYAYNALEPHIDARTMEIHHTKHHQAYIDNLNKAITGTDAEKLSIEDICRNVSKYPVVVRNNGGGHYNHSLFWQLMSPNAGGEPIGEIGQAITKTFGSFDNFKTQFSQAAMGRFGSGWAWLIVDANKNIQIGSTPNQDNPLMDISELKGTPVLGIDVWEHAYYLNYQNRRADYVSAFYNVINWKKVNELYLNALK
ncbi:MAG: superoxide dismutase [Bacteroidota bacterium]|jgi:Fe-Mn family superoxide dismutase